MIKSLSDAKHLVADVHNSIIDSLARKDTEIRRRAIDLLKDLFEENNYYCWCFNIIVFTY